MNHPNLSYENIVSPSRHWRNDLLTRSALLAALVATNVVVAQTHVLPNIGATSQCATTLSVFAGGHGNQSCAVTTPGFLASKLQSDFLRAKCPTAQPLRGLLNNSCTDTPNVHPPHPMGSNFRVTLCCGYAPPAPAVPQSYSASPPVYQTVAAVDAPPPHSHLQLFKVANVPLHMGASNASGCPQVGATYRHIDMPQTLFFRGLERSINNECRSRGSPYGYYSMRLNSCSENMDPQHPPQVHFRASADIFCAR